MTSLHQLIAAIKAAPEGDRALSDEVLLATRWTSEQELARRPDMPVGMWMTPEGQFVPTTARPCPTSNIEGAAIVEASVICWLGIQAYEINTIVNFDVPDLGGRCTVWLVASTRIEARAIGKHCEARARTLASLMLLREIEILYEQGVRVSPGPAFV